MAHHKEEHKPDWYLEKHKRSRKIRFDDDNETLDDEETTLAHDLSAPVKPLERTKTEHLDAEAFYDGACPQMQQFVVYLNTFCCHDESSDESDQSRSMSRSRTDLWSNNARPGPAPPIDDKFGDNAPRINVDNFETIEEVLASKSVAGPEEPEDCPTKVYNTKNILTRSKSISKHRRNSLTFTENQAKESMFAQYKVNWPKAQLYRQLQLPNQGPMNMFSLYSVWKFKLGWFKEFGTGTHLYFHVICLFCITSAILAGVNFALIYSVTLPMNISASNPYALNIFSGFVDQFSAASLFIYNSNTNSNDIPTILGHDALLAVSLLDFFQMLFILLLATVLDAYYHHKERQFDLKYITITDYAVEINNLPVKFACEFGVPRITFRNELKDFFQLTLEGLRTQYGVDTEEHANYIVDIEEAIVDVSIAYNDGHIVEQYQAIGDKLEKLRKLEELAEHTEKHGERTRLYSQIQSIKTEILAFKGKVEDVLFDFNTNHRECVKAFVVFQSEIDRNIILQEFSKGLHITDNCGFNIPKCKYFDGNLLSVTEPCEPHDIRWTNLVHMTLAAELKRCIFTWLILLGQSIITVSVLLALNTQISYNETTHSNTRICLFASGIVIAFSNTVFSMNCVPFVYNFEKHATHQEYDLSIINRVVASAFIHYIFLPLAIIIAQFSTNQSLTAVQKLQIILMVGNIIFIGLVIEMIVPHCVYVVKLPKYAEKRKFAFQTADTQEVLNEKMSGRQFTLPDRCGKVISKFAITVTLAPVLSQFWIWMFAYSFILYWSEKTFFLRIAKQPPEYDTYVAQVSTKYIKIAIVLHCIVAILFYSTFAFENDVPVLTVFFDIKTLAFSLFILFYIIVVCVIKSFNTFKQSVTGIFWDDEKLPTYDEALLNGCTFESYLMSEQPEFSCCYIDRHTDTFDDVETASIEMSAKGKHSVLARARTISKNANNSSSRLRRQKSSIKKDKRSKRLSIKRMSTEHKSTKSNFKRFGTYYGETIVTKSDVSTDGVTVMEENIDQKIAMEQVSLDNILLDKEISLHQERLIDLETLIQQNIHKKIEYQRKLHAKYKQCWIKFHDHTSQGSDDHNYTVTVDDFANDQHNSDKLLGWHHLVVEKIGNESTDDGTSSIMSHLCEPEKRNVTEKELQDFKSQFIKDAEAYASGNSILDWNINDVCLWLYKQKENLQLNRRQDISNSDSNMFKQYIASFLLKGNFEIDGRFLCDENRFNQKYLESVLHVRNYFHQFSILETIRLEKLKYGLESIETDVDKKKTKKRKERKSIKSYVELTDKEKRYTEYFRQFSSKDLKFVSQKSFHA